MVRWAVVSDTPMNTQAERLLLDTLTKVGLDPEEGYFTNVTEERSIPNAVEIRSALVGLGIELRDLQDLEVILAIGNVPLQALSGRTGITKRRGLVRERRSAGNPVPEGSRVFATLHPNAILRNANYYNSWLADLAQFAQLVNPEEDDLEIVWVNGEAGFLQFVAAITDTGALDIETTIADLFKGDVRLISVAMAFSEDRAFVFKPGPWLTRAIARVQHVDWIMHNGLFDSLYLWKMLDWRPHLAHDTMAMQYLINPDERKGLEILSSIHLGMAPYKTIDYDNIETEPWDAIYLMNGRDAVATLRLYRPLADQLNPYPGLLRTYQWLLMPALRALTDVTMTGVPIDRDRLDALRQEVLEEVATLEEELLEATPEPDELIYPKGWPQGFFNPRSTKQVGHVLFDLFGLPVPVLTETGNRSTAAATLQDLVFYSTGIPRAWLGSLSAHRKASKLLSSYLDSWPPMITAAGKLHPRYKPLHVVTGRLASENPNIQQVPRDPRFRGVFGGVDGYSWVKVDLSQIELRLAAWMAEETTMLEALEDGYDLHAMTAEAILGDTNKRQTGKALNFSLLYGAYPKKLQEIAARDYGVEMALEEAEEYHKRFFETYPHLKWWHKDMEASILATGRSESPLGRLRILPDAFSSDRALQNRAVREGINHPIQSFASDLMLMSLVKVNEEYPGLVVATVHDELDLIVPNDDLGVVVPRVVAIMQDTTWLERWGIDLDVPIIAEAEIGRYWNGD